MAAARRRLKHRQRTAKLINAHACDAYKSPTHMPSAQLEAVQVLDERPQSAGGVVGAALRLPDQVVATPLLQEGTATPSAPSTSPVGSQPAPRIDPALVPRPIGPSVAAAQEGGELYDTRKYCVPPRATEVCTIVDSGSCSCEFMRATVNQLPRSAALARAVQVPMAVICQPFAELTPHEEPVPLLDSKDGLLRCSGCRAYVNAYFGWATNGREATCNFCGQRMELPMEHFYSVDNNGKRCDETERLELRRGTVDYHASSSSSGSLQGLPGLFFAIDASLHSVKSGFFHQVLWTLRSLLPYLQPNSRVGLMTFDDTLHFYTFSPNCAEGQQVVVADIDDPFVPCSADRICVDVQHESYISQFDSLLDQLPEMFAHTRTEQAAGCAAAQAAVQLMASRGGGHVLMFHAALPNAGVGALCKRVAGDPRPCSPQHSDFFNDVSANCLAKGVAVSTFLAPTAGHCIDAASLSVLPRRTGGEVHFLKDFSPSRDGDKLHYAISRIALQNDVYNCVFKLRCSKGLAVSNMLATWNSDAAQKGGFQVPRMSPDSTVAFVLSHKECIEKHTHAYLQAVCLYTDRSGRRLVRVHTLRLAVTSSISNIFRYTELDAVTNLLMKQAALSELRGSASRETLTRTCVSMLHAYRTQCAPREPASKLVLPDALKCLPLYVNSLRKKMACPSAGQRDDHISTLCRMLRAPIALSSLLVYPRVFSVSPLEGNVGHATGVGSNVQLPETVASSHEHLVKDGIYLIDNGVALTLYVCEQVSTETLVRIFGVASSAEVMQAFTHGQQVGAAVSKDFASILAIAQQIRTERQRLPWVPFGIVINGAAEGKHRELFVEDQDTGEMRYVDFLCHMHKMVQHKP